MNTHNKSIPKALITLISFLTLLSVAIPAFAANQYPPGKMTFQGFVTDASTPPVPLGNASPENKTVVFKIYRSPNSAAPADVLWAESQVVTVDKGHFSVLLGEGSSVPGFTDKHSSDLSSVFIGADASDRWIGITVDGNEITPRIQFFAAPYAQLAKAANSLVDPTGQTLLNMVNGKLVGTSDLNVTGKVGIGVTSPIGPLQVFNSAAGADSIGGSIVLNRYQNSADDQRGGAIFNYYPSGAGADALAFSVSGLSNPLNLTNVKMVLTQDGRLGIGTNAPKATLDVNGAANVSGMASVGGATVNGNAIVSGTTTLGGNVGIGNPSPSRMLHIGQGANQGPGGLLINTGWLNPSDYSENRPFEVQVRGKSYVVVNTQGNVGIGTTTPGRTLDVAGDIGINDKAIYLRGSADSNHGLRWAGDSATFANLNIDGPVLFGFSGGALGTTSGGQKAALKWTSNGRIGIGTDTPAAALHVVKPNPNASTGMRKGGNDTSYGVYLGGIGSSVGAGSMNGGAGNDQTIATETIAALFDGDTIAGGNAWVGSQLQYSDARAKNLLGTSDSQRDLTLVRDLKVRDFTWIDKTVDDHHPHKKLIAQEVEEVFPQAVRRTPTPTVIPNVYQVAEGIAYDVDRKDLRLTVRKPHGFKVDDFVDLYTDEAPLKKVKVTAVAGECEFTVSSDRAPKSVFVYGKYVTDFRSVDYEAIAMLNVSAVQELDRQVQALKKSEARIAELERKTARIAELEKEAARVDSLERELAALKKLVSGLALGEMPARVAEPNVASALAK